MIITCSSNLLGIVYYGNWAIERQHIKHMPDALHWEDDVSYRFCTSFGFMESRPKYGFQWTFTTKNLLPKNISFFENVITFKTSFDGFVFVKCYQSIYIFFRFVARNNWSRAKKTWILSHWMNKYMLFKLMWRLMLWVRIMFMYVCILTAYVIHSWNY